VIEDGRQRYLAVGRALTAIRDGKLYRETHRTFAAHCLDRWQFSRPQAYRFLAAAEVVDRLSPNGDIPPSEAVVRALVPLRRQPEALTVAWDEARAEFGEHPTSRQVREVVERERRKGRSRWGPAKRKDDRRQPTEARQQVERERIIDALWLVSGSTFRGPEEFVTEVVQFAPSLVTPEEARRAATWFTKFARLYAHQAHLGAGHG
jgi:hypothetical protein